MAKVVKLEWGLDKSETEKWIDDMMGAGRLTAEQANNLRVANQER